MKIILMAVMLGSCLGIGYILNRQLKERIVLLNAILDFSQRALRDMDIRAMDIVNRLKGFVHQRSQEIVKITFECIHRIYKSKGLSKEIMDELSDRYSTRFITNKPYNLYFDEFLNLLYAHGEIARRKELDSKFDKLSRECQRSIDEINTSIKTNYLLAAAAGVVLIILIL